MAKTVKKNKELDKILKSNYHNQDPNNPKRKALMAVDENSPLLKEGHKKFLKGLKKGKTLQEAAKSAGYSTSHGTELAKKLVRYSLKDERLVKKAYKVIEDIAGNKPKLKKIVDGKEIYVYPTHNHQLKAAEMVYERYEPTIKNPLIQLNQQLSPIDLGKYRLVEKGEDDGVIVIDGEQR